MNRVYIYVTVFLFTSLSLFSEGDNKDYNMDPNRGIFDSTLQYSKIGIDEDVGSCCDTCCSCCDWNQWIYPDFLTLGYTGGRGIGYRRGFTTIGIFLAPSFLSYKSLQPFIDLKSYCFDNGKWAGSFGGGVRYLYSNDLVLGFNAYYDYRRIHKTDLNQLGLGVEVLGPRWDFRLNGYIPLPQNRHTFKLFDFGSGKFALWNMRHTAWGGADAELGLWLKRKAPCEYYGIYIAAGPYYYFRNKLRSGDEGTDRNAFGGRVRLLARICNFIDVSVLATYDHIWRTRVQGQIALNIPLDGHFWDIFSLDKCCESSCCDCTPCMIQQPVFRNGIIVSDRDCSFKWNWDDCCSGPYCDVPAPEVSSSDISSSADLGLPTAGPFHSSKFSSSFFDHSTQCIDSK